MTILDAVKIRCGVPAAITVYDTEFQELIADAIDEMASGGVPEGLITADSDTINPRALTAICLYVKANRGDDRTDTELYMKLFHEKAFKLSLEPLLTEDGEV